MRINVPTGYRAEFTYNDKARDGIVVENTTDALTFTMYCLNSNGFRQFTKAKIGGIATTPAFAPVVKVMTGNLFNAGLIKFGPSTVEV